MGIVKRQHRLEPARHGVGDIRDKRPRLGGDHQPLTLAPGEAISVEFAGSDLAVDGAGQGDAFLDFGGGSFAEGEFLFAEHLQGGGGHGLAADFGQLADVEYKRVGYSAQGPEPQFPLTGLGVPRDSDLNVGNTGERHTGGAEPKIWKAAL